MGQHFARAAPIRSAWPMGNRLPKFVEEENAKWAFDHELRFDARRRAQQLPLLENFKRTLYLCSERCQLDGANGGGLSFDHYFVTDMTWTIEFLEQGVAVHSTLPLTFSEESSFERTHAVSERMRAVCGALNYSVTLRNCEHLSRFIENGSWVSHQMAEGADFGSNFADHMMLHKKKMNTLPKELAELAHLEVSNQDDSDYRPLVKNHPGFSFIRNLKAFHMLYVRKMFLAYVRRWG